LRRDHKQFTERDTIILIISPEKATSLRDYWLKHKIPFTGLPDEDKSVLKLYGQANKALKFGRLPAQVLIDKQGLIRYLHYGKSMSDITDNQTIIKLLDQLTS